MAEPDVPEPRAAIDVLALVASAGGLEALAVVLRDLPAELSAAVVMQQHLGDHGSVLPQVLGKLTGRQVAWAAQGERIGLGRMLFCPPAMQLEIRPDRTCALAPSGNRAHDALLTSLADSFGPAALAVVLTGSGSDGAAGVAAMKAAGGLVIAQSEDTAEHPSMPRAAAAAGAGLVLPLDRIGAAIAGYLTSG